MTCLYIELHLPTQVAIQVLSLCIRAVEHKRLRRRGAQLGVMPLGVMRLVKYRRKLVLRQKSGRNIEIFLDLYSFCLCICTYDTDIRSTMGRHSFMFVALTIVK